MMLTILSTLSLLLSLLPTASAALVSPYPKYIQCAFKNVHLFNTIAAFCDKKTPFQVPSDVAKTGAQAKPYGKGPITVNSLKITGACNPKQPVSREVCREQFFTICAEGGKGGGGVR